MTRIKNDVSGIYEIKCEVNKKSYIGQTVELRRRLIDHCRYLHNGKHPNKHLQSAFNLYGANAFEYSVIELCERERLFDREIEIIAERGRNNLFNFTDGGEGPCGLRHSQETKEKLRELKACEYRANREKYQQCLNSPEAVARRVATKQATGNYHNWTEEGREKQRANARRRFLQLRAAFDRTGIPSEKRIAIERIDPKTGEVREYDSMTAAELEGFSSGKISACCKGRYGRKSHGGFYWSYLN